MLVGALAGAGALEAQATEGFEVGNRAPAVTVDDLDGNPVDLGAVIGRKPMYLEFWATWCERCEALLPTVRDAAKRFGDRVEFVGINVTVNENPRRVRKYVEEHAPPFRVLYDTKGVGVRAFHVPTTSYVVIVDAAGIIRYIGVGGEQDLVTALAEAVGM